MPLKGVKTACGEVQTAPGRVCQVGHCAGGLDSSPLPQNCRRAWVGRDFKDQLLWAGIFPTRAGWSLNISRDEAYFIMNI